MTAELLDYFFNEKSKVLSELAEKDRHCLHTLYNSETYAKILPSLPPKSIFPMKRERDGYKKRFEVEAAGRLLFDTGSSLEFQIKNISLSGFGAILNRTVAVGDVYEVDVNIGWGQSIRVSALAVWRASDGSCGYLLKQPTPEWRNLVDSLDNKLLHVPVAG